MKSPWDTLGQIAFSLSFVTYTRVLPSHNVEHPLLPSKQCCFTAKYLCGLKTTLISREEEGKDDFQKNQSVKPYKGESQCHIVECEWVGGGGGGSKV